MTNKFSNLLFSQTKENLTIFQTIYLHRMWNNNKRNENRRIMKILVIKKIYMFVYSIYVYVCVESQSDFYEQRNYMVANSYKIRSNRATGNQAKKVEESRKLCMSMSKQRIACFMAIS